MKKYYKVIVISVDPFESVIEDERNFGNRAMAEAFAHEIKAADRIAVIVEV